MDEGARASGQVTPAEDRLAPLPSTLSQRLAVAAIVLAATLPFLNKAYHIDDVLYLRVANQILHTPWDPLGGQVLWDAEDGQPASLFDTNYNPPFWNYVLAGAIATFAPDRAEWKLHLVQSIAVCFAGFGVFQLSRRFSRHPVWCTGLIILGPFFLPGQNLMLEAPMLALWSWSLEFVVRAWQTQKWPWIVAAGVSISVAVMTKYTAGLLIPLVALGSLWYRRPKALACLILPVLVLAAWTAHSIAFHGQPHLGTQRFELQWSDVPLRLITVARCVGAVTVFGPLVLVILWNKGHFGRLAVAAVTALAAMFAQWDLVRIAGNVSLMFDWNLSDLMKAHYLLFTLHGTIILMGGAVLACGAWFTKNRDIRGFDPAGFLECWMAGMIVFNVFCVPFNAVRHLLMGLVPAVWWISLQLHGIGPRPWLQRLSLGTSALLAFALAWGDYEFAGTYRELARQHVLRYATTGRPTWFTGSWGFAYYASQAGANPLVNEPQRFGLPPLLPNQFIFNATLLNWNPFPPKFVPAVQPIEHLQPAASSFLRTIAPGVNYYSTLDYALPWELLIQRPHEEETQAFYELPPVDDIVIYQTISGTVP